MIKGAKVWYERDHHYSQENNPTELRALKTYSLNKGVYNKYDYLETCGPSAAVGCMAVLGTVDLEIICPGEYKPQPEEVLADFFIDGVNDDEFERIRSGFQNTNIPENRAPQFYPYAVQQVFNFNGASFKYLKSFDLIANYLKLGNSIQLCLKNPSHYVAAVAFDDLSQEIIYNDPNISRKALKRKGFLERMGYEEYNDNVCNYIVVYGG